MSTKRSLVHQEFKTRSKIGLGSGARTLNAGYGPGAFSNVLRF